MKTSIKVLKPGENTFPRLSKKTKRDSEAATAAAKERIDREIDRVDKTKKKIEASRPASFLWQK
jgi:hypothetical protein